jgi:hypothetical protein
LLVLPKDADLHNPYEVEKRGAWRCSRNIGQKRLLKVGFGNMENSSPYLEIAHFPETSRYCRAIALHPPQLGMNARQVILNSFSAYGNRHAKGKYLDSSAAGLHHNASRHLTASVICTVLLAKSVPETPEIRRLKPLLIHNPYPHSPSR